MPMARSQPPSFELDAAVESVRSRTPGLTFTVLWHPEIDRIGMVASIPFPGRDMPIDLSRTTPIFQDGRSLGDSHVSRLPLQFFAQWDGTVKIKPSREGLRFAINGRPGDQMPFLSREMLLRGAALGLGPGPLLLVEIGPYPLTLPRHGLYGPSRSLERVRASVDNLARQSAPVLIRGPAGSGKELVALAIHIAGPRNQRPFVPVNLAALPSATAASVMFGQVTARRAAPGLFGAADGGTLFLDHLGACPREIQTQLLAAVQTGEVRPAGGAPTRLDVRVVSSEDGDLPTDFAQSPLGRVLAQREVVLPALCNRPADVVTQAALFVKRAMEERGLGDKLAPDQPPWLTKEVIIGLLMYNWPGNSRELREVCESLVARHGDKAACVAPDLTDEPIEDEPTDVGNNFKTDEVTDGGLTDAEIEATLIACNQQLEPAAVSLGVSVAQLKRRIDAMKR